MPPGYGAGPYAAPGYGPGYPPPKPSSTGATMVKIVLGIGAAFVLLIVVLVGAVTLLGKSSTSKFSSIGSAIDDPTGVNASPTTVPAWQTWTSPDGHTTVQFPGTPRPLPASAPVNGIAFGPDMLLSTPTGAYEFFYFDVTFGLYYKDPTAALNGAVDGIVKTNSVTNMSRTVTTFAGMPSIEFNGSGSVGADPAEIRGMAVVADKRMYVLVTLNKPGAVPPDWDQFVNSWRIV